METGLTQQQEQIANTLRETILEAEDICRAIRHGEVDAIVAGKNDDEKHVLLMSGAYTRYRQIVEDMRQGAVTVSSSGEILFVNQAFSRMLGEDSGALFRTPLWRWVADADREQLHAVLAPGAARVEAPLTLVRRDRTKLAAHASLVSSSDEFTTLLITDLEDDRQSDADARATLDAIRRGAVDAFVVDGKQVMILDSARSPYRALVERMRQGAVTIGPDGLAVFANERFASMIGKPHGTILGSPLLECIAESDRAAFRTLLHGRDGTQAELRLRGPNGALVSTQATITLVEDHKLLLFADVSERKRHQAFDELTRKFLGMMAHEFRNILGPIGNSVEVLKRTPGMNAEAQKAIALIERQAERMLALVEDLRRINPRD